MPFREVAEVPRGKRKIQDIDDLVRGDEERLKPVAELPPPPESRHQSYVRYTLLDVVDICLHLPQASICHQGLQYQ